MTSRCYLFSFFLLSPIFGPEHFLFLSVLHNEGTAFLVTHCHSCVILPTWQKRKYFWSVNFPNVLCYSGTEGTVSGKDHCRRERAQSSLAEAETWSLEAGWRLPVCPTCPGHVSGAVRLQQLIQVPPNILHPCSPFLLFQDRHGMGKQWL